MKAYDDAQPFNGFRKSRYREMEAAITAILDEIHEPSGAMLNAAEKIRGYGEGVIWRAMLNASPLGEQDDGKTGIL